MIGIGLDFGTSNSTAAWFDGERLHYVELERSGPVLPTAIHLDRNFAALTGSDAIERYVEENRGRRVELVAEVIGAAAGSITGNETGDHIGELETRRHLIYGPLTDRGLPGRLFLGLKRLLGDPELHRLSVFDRHFRLVALITPILLRMREGIEAETAGKVEQIHVGRPVNFEGRDPQRNETAVARLAESYAHAGFGTQHFYPEPVAATLSYLFRERPRDRGTALTVDFGGGTLDLSVVAFTGEVSNVLGTSGIALGGDRIDQQIFERMLFPLLGKGERWSRVVDGQEIETLFPFEEYETALLNWPITHTLNQNRTKTIVQSRLAQGGPATGKFERLNDLITYNYSYNCFQAIRIAKVALSDVEHTVIDIPELNLVIPFSRAQLESILQPALATLSELIDALLRHLGLGSREIDIVIRTGGSSQIAAVKRLLEERFTGKVVAHDPFTSVAGGLAIASFNAQSGGAG
ncbi:MAG: Hsp70 family protein [Pseudomonadota bacterium]